MRLMSQTRSVFGGTDIWKKSEWALALVSLITGFFAISIVPFTRKDFGERYFGWLNLYFGYSLLASFMFFGKLLGAFFRFSSSELMSLFWLGFIGLSLYHRRQISLRNKTGVEWHTMYMGTSHLETLFANVQTTIKLPITLEQIYKVYEPATVFIVGYFLWQLSGQIGLWLMIGAVSLLVNNHIIFYQERQAVLDLRDAHIEAKYMSDAFAGKPAKQTAGFVVSESSIQLVGSDAKLSEAFSRLSAEMKGLLDAPPDFNGGDVA